MQTTNIRQQLHQYVDTSDEKLLKMMFAIAKEYNEYESDLEYEFSDEEIKELDDRWQKHLNGESKSYTWQETKEIITGKK